MQAENSGTTAAAGEAGEAPRLKSSCEPCVRAKVKCSGAPGPCERCRGWRNLDCVFVEERKRGRPRLHFTNSSEEKNNGSSSSLPTKPAAAPVAIREGATTRARRAKEDATCHDMETVNGDNDNAGVAAAVSCATTECWSQVVNLNYGQIEAPTAVAPGQGLDPEQAKVVALFFDLYKNHASNRSCCKAWFGRQLNKIATMLKRAGSTGALKSLLQWMNKHGIAVQPVSLPEKNAFQDPDTGFALPPMTSSKGPMLTDSILIAAAPKQPLDALDSPEKLARGDCACIRLVYDRDERCTVMTSPRFEELFGRNAAGFMGFLNSLCGGILPWGVDVFSTLMSRSSDALLLVRMLAFEFMQQPRPTAPGEVVVRRVNTSHLWSCVKSNGDTVDCVVRLEHVEKISLEDVEVEVTAQFEVCKLLPPMICSFPSAAAPIGKDSRSLASVSVSTTATSPDEHFSGEEATVQDDEEDFYFRPFVQHKISQTSIGTDNDNWVDDLLHWVDEERSS